MDLSRPVTYRRLALNSADQQFGAISGLTVERIDYSNVSAVGYTEKRAATDGIHASDVYLGQRLVEMNGIIYATSLPELLDWLHTVRAVFSPTSAYQEAPGDQGFLPFQFQSVTTDTASFPGNIVNLQMFLRPMNGPRFVLTRDIQGGQAWLPKSIPYTVQLFARDPRVYVDPEQSVVLSGGPFNPKSGNAINRGDYESPLNIMLVVGSTAPGVGKTFRLTGLNGIDMTIKLLNEANRVYRWRGDDRVLMVQDSTANPAGENPETLRMDLVTFASRQRKVVVPASIWPATKPFSTAYNVYTTAVLATGSRMFWWEAFA